MAPNTHTNDTPDENAPDSVWDAFLAAQDDEHESSVQLALDVSPA